MIGRRNKPLKWMIQRGYANVDLWDGRHNRKRVSRLVLLAFAGEPPTPDHEAAHLDGDSLNNSIDNLAWKTRQENEDDKKRHGTRPMGERAGNAALSNVEALEIREEYALGVLTQTALGEAYGVSQDTISRVVRGLRYAS